MTNKISAKILFYTQEINIINVLVCWIFFQFYSFKVTWELRVFDDQKSYWNIDALWKISGEFLSSSVKCVGVVTVVIFSLPIQKGALDSVQLNIYFYLMRVHRERFCYHCEMLDVFDFLHVKLFVLENFSSHFKEKN